YQLLEDYALNHQLWDGVLNEIYGVLKTILSEAEMNDLKNEQRQWIKDRDEKVEAMPGYEEAGSLGRAEKVEAKFQITKERCYELVNNYME
ncbi:lysozyme inhibitor LprI family protein, partial [Rossellomorea vietnamensis]|uniref:lysozyme inhibitor LprI family protein n=1 Tax=Rossellomorea vietnamensis TaxID=218284 RepID=UPI003092A850